MKHPVSVSELLELHRLGDLYVKWSSNPFAMSEEDLEELQRYSSEYSIDGTSALFAFQKQFQHEFGLDEENTRSVTDVAREAMQELKEHVAKVEFIEKPQLTPREVYDGLMVDRYNGLEINLDDAWTLARHLGRTFEQFHDDVAKRAGASLWFQEKIWFSGQEALQESQERNTAVIEAVQEDNELDRESQAEHRANQLRDFREQLQGEMTDAREIEILREISNVDELTKSESDRLDQLLKAARPKNGSSTIQIPTDVLAEAVSGNEKGQK